MSYYPPAFPLAASEYGGNGPEYGMTLRDYFAANAMQALITNDQVLRAASVHYEGGSESSIARIAYEQADAMLAARDK